MAKRARTVVTKSTQSKKSLNTRERIYQPTRSAWRSWLSKHHGSSPGIWLVYDKKGRSKSTLTYEEIVMEALCFGWIDSLPRSLSQTQAMLLVTPRKKGSAWSAANKARVRRLEAEGRLTPAGLAAIERAKKDGTWEKLTRVQTLETPPDLEKALRANPAAGRFYRAFPPSSKRIILEWIAAAKRPETRAARIEETARLAAQNLRAHHYRQPKSAAKQ